MSGTVLIYLLFTAIHLYKIPKINISEYEVKPIELSDLVLLEENIKLRKDREKPLEEIIKSTPPVVTEDEFIIQDLKETQEIIVVRDSTEIFSESDEDISLLHSAITQLNQDEENDSSTIYETNRNTEFRDERNAILRYIYQNIQYPPLALKQRINGRVICSFIINEDGSISDVALIQGVYIFLDEEVLRVINSMPLMNPAKQDGKAIKIKIIMPVVFRLG